MIKKVVILHLILVFVGCSSVQAQKEYGDLKEREFAFNSTQLLTSFLPFDSNPILNVNDFSMVIKKKAKRPGVYNRTAFSLIVDSENDFNTNAILFKKGAEKKVFLSDSWLFHWGGEGFIGVSSASVFSTRTELGITGLYGLQWRINDRVGLGTEGYVELSLLDSPNSIGLNVKFRQPRTLLFSIYF